MTDWQACDFVVDELPGDRLVAPFGPQALERTETPGGRLHRLPDFGEGADAGQFDRLEAARERQIGPMNRLREAVRCPTSV